MKRVTQETFAKEGNKEVIRFFATPPLFESADEAYKALMNAIEVYAESGKGYTVYVAEDKYSAVILVD